MIILEASILSSDRVAQAISCVHVAGTSDSSVWLMTQILNCTAWVCWNAVPLQYCTVDSVEPVCCCKLGACEMHLQRAWL